MSKALDSETLDVSRSQFSVRLDNFEGPFDLLLSLIARRKMDVTEVALSLVTDEFITYIADQGPEWDVDQVSSFLVVASSLLDLKTARLLPGVESDSTEDLAMLEARDLLFARLLQYRAFKQVAAWLQLAMDAEHLRVARPGGWEEPFLDLLPDVDLGLSRQDFAELALAAMTPAAQAEVYVGHIYLPPVSVAEQANLMADRLQRTSATTFRALVADAESLAVTVARFLSVLELYRGGLVKLEQLNPFSDLVIRWVGASLDEVEVSDEYVALPKETT